MSQTEPMHFSAAFENNNVIHKYYNNYCFQNCDRDRDAVF